jgi:DNA-binding response OmpR family regulator
MRVLVVTPDADLRRMLAARLSRAATVDAVSGFDAARGPLLATPYDLLLTDLRLAEYNGLHLVHLAATMGLPTRAIVFSAGFDPYLASETRAAGAFYEHTNRIVAAAPGYLHAVLPEHDRRDPRRVDRRIAARGGRRAADLAMLPV